MKKRKNTKRVTEEEAIAFAKAVNKSARNINESLEKFKEKKENI
jgi:hypothetical protein